MPGHPLRQGCKGQGARASARRRAGPVQSERGSGAEAAADRLKNVPCLREAVGSVNSHYHIYNLGHSHWILLVARCDTMTVDVFDGMLSRTFDGCRTDAYRTDVMAAANHFAHYLYTVTGNETFNTFEINLHGKELMWQRDGTSCGVFACIAMEHLVSEAAIRIHQMDMFSWRPYVAAKIYWLSKQLRCPKPAVCVDLVD